MRPPPPSPLRDGDLSTKLLFWKFTIAEYVCFLSLNFGKNSFPKIHGRSVFHIKFNFVCRVNEIFSKKLSFMKS